MALPTGYTELPWIDNNGGQAKTLVDWQWNSTDLFELMVSWDTTLKTGTEKYYFFGSSGNTQPSSSNIGSRFDIVAGNMYYVVDSGTRKSVTVETYQDYFKSGITHTYYTSTANPRQIKDKDEGSFNKNVLNLGTAPSTSYSTTRKTILAGGPFYASAATNMQEYKFHGLKVMNSAGTETYNFVPAKRNSDSKIGIYDTQHSKFYTSITSSEFRGDSKSEPTLSLSIPGTHWAGSATTFNVTTTSDGLVTVYYNNQSIGTAYNGGTVTHDFGQYGNYTVTATVAETSQYETKTITYDFTLTVIAPTITQTNFSPGNMTTTGTATFTTNSDSPISAVIKQGGVTKITFQAQSSPATFTWVNYGNLEADTYAEFIASVAATGKYSAKDDTSGLYVPKATPTLSVTASGNVMGQPTVFTISTSSDGLVTITDTDTSTTIGTGYNGDTVSTTYSTAGTHNWRADIAATSRYYSNWQTGSVTMQKLTPTLSVSITGTTYGDTTVFTLSTNSDGLITVTDTDTSTVLGTGYNGDTVSHNYAAGTHNYSLTLAETSSYLSGGTTGSIVISQAVPTLSFTVSGTTQIGNTLYLKPTSNSDGLITFTEGQTSIGTCYTGGYVEYTPSTTGDHTIEASIASTQNYTSYSVSDTITIDKIQNSVEITMDSSNTYRTGDSVKFTVSALGTGTLTVTANGTTISPINSVYTIANAQAQQYAITATKAADSTYDSGSTTQNITVQDRQTPVTTISFSGGTTVGDTNLVSVQTDSDGILTLYMNGSVFTDSAFTAYSATTYNFSAHTTQTLDYAERTVTATRTFSKAANSVYLDIQGTFKEYDPMTITVSALTNTLITVYADNTQIGTATHEGTFTYTHEGYGTVVIKADAEGDSDHESGTTSQTITIEHVKLNPTTTYTVTGEAKVGSERHIYANTTSDSDITVKWNGTTIGTIENPNGTIDYTPTVAGYSTLSFHTEETFNYNSGVTEAQIWEDKGDNTLSIYIINSAHTGTDWSYTVSASTTNTDSNSIHYDAYRKNNDDWILYSSGDTTAGTTFTFADQQAGDTYIGKLEVSQAETANFNSASTYTMLTYNGDLSSMVTLGDYAYYDWYSPTVRNAWKIEWYYNVRVYETYNGFPYTISVQRKVKYTDNTESQWVSCNGYTFDATHSVLASDQVYDTYTLNEDIQYVKLKFIFPEGTNFPYAEYETDWARIYFPKESDLKVWTDKEELTPMTVDFESEKYYNSAYTWGETVYFNASATTNPNPIKLVHEWVWHERPETWETVTNPVSSAYTITYGDQYSSSTVTVLTAFKIKAKQDRYYDESDYTWNEVPENIWRGQYILPQPAIPDLTITVLNEGKIHAGEVLNVLISTPSDGQPVYTGIYKDNGAQITNINPTPTSAITGYNYIFSREIPEDYVSGETRQLKIRASQAATSNGEYASAVTEQWITVYPPRTETRIHATYPNSLRVNVDEGTICIYSIQDGEITLTIPEDNISSAGTPTVIEF